MSRCTCVLQLYYTAEWLRLQSTAASAYVRNRFKPDPHRVTDKEFTYLILCVPLSVLRIGRSFPSLGNVNGHKVGVVFLSDSVSVLSIVGLQPQHPHPAAPVQLKEAFSDFLQKYKRHLSPSLSKSIRQDPRGLMFNDFWEAPRHLWQPKIRHLEDAEIDAILVSSMSLSMPPLVLI
jgi:small subunit ribosomal protein YMR-31